MIVSENSTGSYARCPSGSFLGRCVRLIDLGTQTSDFQGEVKTARKVLVAFEILDADTRRDDGAPHVLSKPFTMSLHEKSALRKDLASWRGRDFTPEELRGFDLRSILGKDAFLSVIEVTKADRKFSNIASIMRPPKGMVAPEGTANEPLVYWSMSDPNPDWAAFATMHPKLVAQIEASPEFQRLNPPRRINTGSAPDPSTAQRSAPQRPPAAPPQDASDFDDLDADIPF